MTTQTPDAVREALVAQTIYESGGSFADQNGFIPWAKLDGTNDAENFRKMARAVLAALDRRAGDALPSDGTCSRCGAAPRHHHTGLCATCTDEVAPAVDAVPAGEVGDMAWFGGQHRLSLSHYSPMYGDDDDQSVEWRVMRESGPINDREWDIVGRGATPCEAVSAARAALSHGEGRK